MKCNVWFVLAKDFFWSPSEVNIESYFVKGSSIDECMCKARDKVKCDWHALTIQEINVRVVK